MPLRVLERSIKQPPPSTWPEGSSIVYIVRSFPRLSQTFVLGEILALERLGLNLRLFAVTDPRERVIQREVSRLKAEVSYLERSSPWFGRAVAGHLRIAMASPLGYGAALLEALRQRDSSRGYHAATAWQCFGHAVRLTNAIRGKRVGRIHAHFAHDPTLIALLAHLMTGLPYSFTAHARDVYQVPPKLLARRAERCKVLFTCSEASADHLKAELPGMIRDRIRSVHHGVDVGLFRPPSRRIRRSVPEVISVGRLVEKKGFPDLLRALGQVKDSGTVFRCAVYGEGPLLAPLSTLAAELGLMETVRFMGARPQWELMEIYRRADIFALTPLQTDQGDVDGIPNVIVEAMAAGLAVVATTAGGIPEAVTSGVDGLLATPRDVAGLAEALRAVLVDPDLRERLGREARRTAVGRFDRDASAGRLLALLQRT
jgi:glycosyltransferase involved in cell wall biosynthesis